MLPKSRYRLGLYFLFRFYHKSDVHGRVFYARVIFDQTEYLCPSQSTYSENVHYTIGKDIFDTVSQIGCGRNPQYATGFTFAKQADKISPNIVVRPISSAAVSRTTKSLPISADFRKVFIICCKVGGHRYNNDKALTIP